MALTPARAAFRFYAELNDHLPHDQQYRTVPRDFFVPAAGKDMIESSGVPHTEVDLVIVNGESSDFSRLVRNGDRVAVYPVFESLDIDPSCTSVRKLFASPGAFSMSSSTFRRDRWYWVRETDSRHQAAEVVRRFDLAGGIDRSPAAWRATKFFAGLPYTMCAGKFPNGLQNGATSSRSAAVVGACTGRGRTADGCKAGLRNCWPTRLKTWQGPASEYLDHAVD
jgi:hypothetical protein